MFTSNLHSSTFTRSTFLHSRDRASFSHAKMSFNLTNGENTGLDGSFPRPSIDRSSGPVPPPRSSLLAPRSVIFLLRAKSRALKLNNSVNGNGVSTAKDSHSSFDVEPVCSHVKRITWIIEGELKSLRRKWIFIPLSFPSCRNEAPSWFSYLQQPCWCTVCRSSITSYHRPIYLILILSRETNYKLSLSKNVFI